MSYLNLLYCRVGLGLGVQEFAELIPVLPHFFLVGGEPLFQGCSHGDGGFRGRFSFVLRLQRFRERVGGGFRCQLARFFRFRRGDNSVYSGYLRFLSGIDDRFRRVELLNSVCRRFSGDDGFW